MPRARSFYFDWRRTRKAQQAFDAAFTPAVSLIRGLDVALGLLLERGLELGRGDGKALQRAEHIGEPKADEADPPLLDRPQDVVELLLHADSVRSVFRPTTGRKPRGNAPFTLTKGADLITVTRPSQ